MQYDLPSEFISPYKIENIGLRVKYRRFISLLHASKNFKEYSEDFKANGGRTNKFHSGYFYDDGPFNSLGFWGDLDAGENYRKLECIFQAMEGISEYQRHFQQMPVDFKYHENNLTARLTRFSNFQVSNLDKLCTFFAKKDIYKEIEEHGLDKIYKSLGWCNYDE